jgi:hypothetical protein
MTFRSFTRARGPLHLGLVLAAGAALVSGCTGAGAGSSPGAMKVSTAPVVDSRQRPATRAPEATDACGDGCLLPGAPVPEPHPAVAVADAVPVSEVPRADRPVVTIRAVGDASSSVNDGAPCSTMSAASLERGELEVLRSGAVDTPLVVRFTASGTAIANGDLEPLPNDVTIPAGASHASVWVTPTGATGPAPVHVHRSSTLALTLAGTDAYDVGAAATAELTLHFDIDRYGCPTPTTPS